MASEITTADGADGQRALAQRALSLLPSTTDRLTAALGADAPACIEAAAAKLEHDLRPVPVNPEERAAWALAVDDRLRRLAVKVLPTAREADTQEWRSAMADALSDLPAMIALTAAKRALHRPFRFIGEIEAAVREIAADLIAEYQTRLNLLRRHREDIERAQRPTPALPAPDDRPITQEAVDRVNSFLERYGLDTRFSADMAAESRSTYVPQEEAA